MSTPLIEGSKLLTLEEKRNLEWDNRAYKEEQDNASDNAEKVQKWAMEGIWYSKFQIPEQDSKWTSNNENIEENKDLVKWPYDFWVEWIPDKNEVDVKSVESRLKEWEQIEKDLETFKENPNFPILKRFTEIKWKNWDNLNVVQLDENTLNEISKILGEWWEEKDLVKNLEKLDSELWNIEFDNPMTADYLSVYINKTINLNNSSKQMVEKDGKSLYSLPEEFKTNETLNNQDSEITQLLIKNYTKLPDLDNWWSNFEKDILTTFEITANKIIEWKQFIRNDWYELAMADIKNWDIETRFEALNYINSLVNTAEWLKWVKNRSSFDKIKWEHNNKKEKYLDFKVEQLEKQIFSTNDKSEKIKLSKELEKVEKMKDTGDFEWEIFKSLEFDKISDDDPSSNLENS